MGLWRAILTRLHTAQFRSEWDSILAFERRERTRPPDAYLSYVVQLEKKSLVARSPKIDYWLLAAWVRSLRDHNPRSPP
ncbi:MAG: hypothetical protein HF312_15700 [Ignavibacteria bacterium]|jgi:hypothetical protein|nr:hypothetical protein [Ignavibacteria bacterium]